MKTEPQADKKPRRVRAKPDAAVQPVVAVLPPLAFPENGQARAVIDAVLPQVDAGRFAVKRVVGEPLEVSAHVFTDGHDKVRARLCWRAEGMDAWREAEMLAQGNDVWAAALVPDAQGRWRYTVCAWVDHFQSWRAELQRRVDLADILIAARVGAELVRQAGERAQGDDRARLADLAEQHCAAVPSRPAAPPSPRSTRSRSKLPPSSNWLWATTWPHGSTSTPTAATPSGGAWKACRWRWTVCVPPSAAGTRCSRARPRWRRAATAPSRTCRRACPMWPRWASTCCTCRRSTPSAARGARAATTS